MIRAVLFDLGGVVLTSPFEEFERYEARAGLPRGAIRSINSTAPDTNAWARLERGELAVETFVPLFEAEAAALGFAVDGWKVLECLNGQVRAEMRRAVEGCAERLATAVVTNNFVSWSSIAAASSIDADLTAVLGLVDVVVESSVVGVRKPEVAFYRLALDALGVAAKHAVLLDDLGVNLKPAREMGMHTIKVTDPAVAIAELETLVGFSLT